MWNARRNGRWFGWGCLFLSCSILLFRSAAVLRKNHFSEGKVLLQRAAAQAEQLSVDVMMPLLFYDGKEDGRGWMENLLAVRDQIPALREGSTAENTLSAGTEAAETDTAKQDSNPGPGAERGQTESKEQGTEEDQKDGTQKDETQKDGTGAISDLTTYIDPTKYNVAFADAKLSAKNIWVQCAIDCIVRRKMSAKQIPNL